MADERCYECDGNGMVPTSHWFGPFQIFTGCTRCFLSGKEPPHNSRELYAGNLAGVELDNIVIAIRKKNAKP